MSAGPSCVTVRGLGRRFGQAWAVQGIDLDLDAGERVGIVGPDGAGKTTLLQMLAAILDPTVGECSVFGLDSRRQSKAIASQLGYMTQGFTLYDRLTVDENLKLATRLRGVAEDTFVERRQRLLQMAGLQEAGRRRAGQLSGGMRKKLSLCCTLIHAPRLLILDEPGLGVDPLSRRQLWDILGEFQAAGVALIVATSYMDEAEACDRVLLLRDGQVLATNRPAVLRRQVAGQVFECRTSEPLAVAARLRHDADVRGVQVFPDRVRVQRTRSAPVLLELAGVASTPVDATLEDVFVLLAGADGAIGSIDLLADQSPREPQVAEGDAEQHGAVDVHDLSVRFARLVAVDAVSLRAAPGELLALLGPNGAGKTTLIRALCGLLPIASGRGRVAGHRVGSRDAALRQRLGYMSQRFSLYADLTPAENLNFFASAYNLRGRTAASAIAWATARTAIDVGQRQRVADLSGATRQRLALACSILHRPDVLFLDEPTSGIDPLARFAFWALIRSLAAEGISVLVTTHYLDEAAYCDRIGLMHRGRLIALDTLAGLRRQHMQSADASVEDVFIAAITSADVELRVA